MKKWSLILAVVLLAALLTAPQASAAAMEGPVGTVTVYHGTPEVDGVISEGEYSGAKKVLINHTCMKALEDVLTLSEVPEDLLITAYQLWDETGLYLAFQVQDSTPASGAVINNNWYFNGDNIQFFIDPGPSLSGEQLVDAETYGGRRSPLYSFGMNEDASFYILRQLVKNEMILNLSPDAPKSAATVEENGSWTIELCLPWEMLVTDINEKLEEGTLAVTDFQEGMKIKAMVIYNDVKLDGETRTPMGMYETSLYGSTMPFGWDPELFGITFVLSATEHSQAPEETPEPTPEATLEPTPTPPVKVVSEAEELSETGNGGLSTAVIVIVIAAVVAGILALVLILLKKKKN